MKKSSFYRPFVFHIIYEDNGALFFIFNIFMVRFTSHYNNIRMGSPETFYFQVGLWNRAEDKDLVDSKDEEQKKQMTMPNPDLSPLTVHYEQNPGRLKLQSDKVIFRNVKTGKVDTYSKSDIEKINWLIRARGYCLKFSLNNGTVHRYDGFKEKEFDKLASYVKKSYSSSLEKKDLSLKGWNWGTAIFNGNNLDFQVENKTAFEVPLNNVSHSATGKNEVTLEFHQNDDAPVALTELRFFIPADTANPDNDAVEEFYNNVMSKADVIQAIGDAVAVFSEVQCLTPRGRYDVKIYPSFLQLHGKTFDYKIPYTTILRLFLLPHRDGRQMYFVISLDPPIKQGQTRYHFLIAVFSKDVETTIELGLSDEAIAEKYGGKLQKEMSGLEYEIVSRIMKTLVEKKITVPGTFVGHTGTQSVQCSYKAATGLLYPLERGFIFVHKPPMHIRFDEVTSVNFARSSGSTRSFDFEVETRIGTSYTFVGMEKDEYGKLYDFVTQKKLRVKNVEGSLGGGGRGKVSYDSDDGSEDGHDAYLERMKAEGRDRDDDDQEEDESTDEDFVAPDSGSEVAEEFDTDAESSESEGEGEVGEDGEKKKKKKKEKKTITIKEPGMSKPRKPKGEGSSREPKKGKKKDKNAPKRPMSGFFLWLNENREKIKTDNPGIGFTDIGKKGGEMWKEITADEKAKYDDLNKKAKERYEVEMKEYQEKLKDNPPTSPESTPKKKKSSAKKSPKSGAVPETKMGSGENFKSKEYISDSGSESSDDDEDTPLKKMKEKKAEKSKKKEKKRGKSGDKSSGDDSPSKKKSKDESGEFDGLPSDEEILSSPEASGSESGGGGSESGSGGGSGSDED